MASSSQENLLVSEIINVLSPTGEEDDTLNDQEPSVEYELAGVLNDLIFEQ